MTDISQEIQPEDVQQMLPIWYERAQKWRGRVNSLARKHQIPAAPKFENSLVTNGSANGVAFMDDTIAWVEKDYDGILDSFEAPYDAVRTEDSGDVWIDEWLTQELRKKDQEAILEAEHRRTAQKRREREERELFERLKQKFEGNE